MSTSKHFDLICLIALGVALVLAAVVFCGHAMAGASEDGAGSSAESRVAMEYESRLFDCSKVHSIDIQMDNWDEFIASAESEEYAAATLVIDGETFSNVGLRAKGNTSLTQVRSRDSSRYSLKAEFDHYDSSFSYYGLDKLCLNNLIQDNTMMKDYLVYRMMADFGVDAPLCSYAYLTVNGEDWGLFLAVEGIEDSFLTRTYGTDAGDLYKPDSGDMGGGRGNGKGFDMDDFGEGATATDKPDGSGVEVSDGQPDQQQPGGQLPGEPPSGQMPDGRIPSEPNGQIPDGQQPGGQMPGEPPDVPGAQQPDDLQQPDDQGQLGGGGPGGSMGSADVKLQYIDDNADSYSNIFDNAKTAVSKADKKRLIASLKNLSQGTDLENVVDTDEVIRYFVVHNFVCNGDSYTGAMIHNYYLHETDGVLSMIPWDYNLAFGGFQSSSATNTVNESVDNPISGGNLNDRPMVAWIFSDDAYTSRYHELFGEFIDRWFAQGELLQMIADTEELITPYVENDPTKFCTAEDFHTGVAALKSFVTLRAEAVSQQLESGSSNVDASSLDLSDMGSMGMGGDGARGAQDRP